MRYRPAAKPQKETMMARRINITNQALGPRGWPVVGSREPHVLQRGETATITVSENVFQVIQGLADQKKPEVILEDLGEVWPDTAEGPTGPMSGKGDEGTDGRQGRAASKSPDESDVLAAQLELAKKHLVDRDETIRRQGEEIARLTAGGEGGEPKEPKAYEIGPFVGAALKAAEIENLSDLQAVLDAIEHRFLPFAKFDPDGDGRPGGQASAASAETGGETDQTPPQTGPGGGAGDAERDHFDDMDDAQLRAFIKAQTEKEPHPNAKRETLLKKAREADSGEAV